MGFKEDVEAAKAEPARFAILPIEVAGKRHKFKFTKMDGVAFAAETLRHPPRMEITIDREFGYNVSALSLAVAPLCGVRLDGDEHVSMSADEWRELFDVVDGGAIESITNTIFELNEFSSAKAVRAAKKVLDVFRTN